MEFGKFLFLNLHIAVRSFRKFRVRSMLAVTGVLFGSLSLIVVYNISKSMTLKAAFEIEKLGENMVIVRSGTVRRFGRGVRLFTAAANLTEDDAYSFREKIAFVDRVAPVSTGTFPVRYGQNTLNDILVVGTVHDYQYVRNHFPSKGRFIDGDDAKGLKRNIVIGDWIAKELFGEDDPIGKHVLIYRAPCRIIGVMEEKGVDASGVDQDRQVFMHLRTFQRRFVHGSDLNMVLVSATHENIVSYVQEQIGSLLRLRHNIGPDQQDDFSVLSLKDVMELKEKAMRLIDIVGKVAAFLSFLIGGIGILSIMILIVNERRPEIGLRRAVGSRKKDIILQFMTESAFISLTGAVSGLITGSMATFIIYAVMSLPVAFSFTGIVISFFVSVVIGITAGIYPSKKAVRIQPIDIIRG